MGSEKNQIIEMIRSLPDNSTVVDIMEELYFRLDSHQSAKNTSAF